MTELPSLFQKKNIEKLHVKMTVKPFCKCEMLSNNKIGIVVLLTVNNKREVKMHFHSFCFTVLFLLHFSLLHAVSRFILNLLESSTGDMNTKMAMQKNVPPAHSRPYIPDAEIEQNFPGFCVLFVAYFLHIKVLLKSKCGKPQTCLPKTALRSCHF